MIDISNTTIDIVLVSLLTYCSHVGARENMIVSAEKERRRCVPVERVHIRRMGLLAAP